MVMVQLHVCLSAYSKRFVLISALNDGRRRRLRSITISDL